MPHDQRTLAVSKRQFGYELVVLATVLACGSSAVAAEHGPGHAAAPPVRSFPSQRGAVHGTGPGYIGIDVRDISDDEVSGLKLHDSRGAEIVKVDHDGPAGKMGLREHDVVLQFNGITIETEEQIRRMLKDLAPGKTVVLVISRDGQQQTMTTQMADKAQLERDAWEQHLGSPQAPANALPANDTTGSSISAAPAPSTRYSKSFLGTLLTSPTYTGAMLEMMGPQMAQFFGVQDGSGLLVRKIDPNSPAAMAGLRLGDYVLRANARPVKSVGDWSKAVREAKGRPIAVVIMRDKQERTLTLTPDVKHRSDLELPLEPAPNYHLACLTEL